MYQMPNPKFIIEDGNLIISKCKFHKDIAKNHNNVIGGGWFMFNKETTTFKFYGSSEDFGRATMEQIKECINSNRVYLNNRCKRNVSNMFNFEYDTGSETIKL